MPEAATAVFVGTEFDSLVGRGGGDSGEPLRKTPWGEIAWQLMKADGLSLVAEHEKQLVAPGGDVIDRFLPRDRPTLILLDELMNYISRSRKSGLAAQFYTFLHNLSEVARSRDDVVLAVSIPASELEMNAEDQADFERLKKLLDRLGKAVIMSAETETSEIIRRRLFEWKGVPTDGAKVSGEFAEWVTAHRHQVPNWFPVDNAHAAFASTYPFHPSVLSVFERKWRGLPRFQQTRGVLRLLALWVSSAYDAGYKGAHKDPLITLGTAPIHNPLFRAALFEQLGEQRLEAAVTTDISGKEHAHALRLDHAASADVKKGRLHQKVATSIFFESNGGQQRGEATLPEVRLAVAEPALDIGNVENCLEALIDGCYYLTAQKNRYRFSFQPNLNKVLADRRASVGGDAVRQRVRAEVQKVFGAGRGVERVFFPEKSSQVPDRVALTLAVADPELEASDKATRKKLEAMTKEYGSTARTYKSAVVWCVADGPSGLNDEARRLLAWEDIEAESSSLRLDEAQGRQLDENLKRSKRDLKEAVWRAYKNLFLLDESNNLRHIDLGLVHSSAAESLAGLVLSRLQQEDLVVDGVSPNFLVRNWPPALPEWSTRQVRDAFSASPKFPRLLNADVVKQTVSRGVEAGVFAYVSKLGDGSYKPFVFGTPLSVLEVEVTDDVFLIRKEDAQAYVEKQNAPKPEEDGDGDDDTGDGGTTDADDTGSRDPFKYPDPDPKTGVLIARDGGNDDQAKDGDDDKTGEDDSQPSTSTGFRWRGEISPQKWMNFYTKVMARFATTGGLRVVLDLEVEPAGGVTKQRLDETRLALRELGLSEELEPLAKDDG